MMHEGVFIPSSKREPESTPIKTNKGIAVLTFKIKFFIKESHSLVRILFLGKLIIRTCTRSIIWTNI